VEEAAKAATTPSESKSAVPIAPGISCRRTEDSQCRDLPGAGVTGTFGAPGRTFERVLVTPP
jgi:hypothetical protein